MNDADSRHPWLGPLLLTTAMFSALGGSTIAPALPAIRQAYNEIPNIEFWCKTLIAVTGLFSALGAVVFGWFSDRFGRRLALKTALLLWGGFGASGMIPQPFWMLLTARACFGLSLGGLLTANTAMIADCFTRQQQRKMMGLQSTFSSTGVILGLIISGWLASLHWRWSFAIFLVAFCILPAVSRVPEPARQNHPAPDQPQRNLGLCLLYLFAFLAVFSFNIIPTQMPFFASNHGIHGSRHLGIILAILPLASAVAGRLYAGVSKKINSAMVFCLAGMIMWSGFHLFDRWQGPSNIIIGLIMIGLGFGLAMPHVNIVMARMVRPSARGRAMGLLTSCKFMGQFFSPILLQPILVHKGYGAMLIFSGWLMLTASLLTAGMTRAPDAAEQTGESS